MDQSLEELRAQRESIQRHLDWLDRQIRSAERSRTPSAGKASDAVPESDISLGAWAKAPSTAPAGPEKTPDFIPTTDARSASTGPGPAASPRSAPASPTPRSTIPYERDPDSLLAPQNKTESELFRAKIGCFALFAVCTLGFLFLLFGLPYVLEWLGAE